MSRPLDWDDPEWKNSGEKESPPFFGGGSPWQDRWIETNGVNPLNGILSAFTGSYPDSFFYGDDEYFTVSQFTGSG